MTQFYCKSVITRKCLKPKTKTLKASLVIFVFSLQLSLTVRMWVSRMKKKISKLSNPFCLQKNIPLNNLRIRLHKKVKTCMPVYSVNQEYEHKLYLTKLIWHNLLALIAKIPGTLCIFFNFSSWIWDQRRDKPIREKPFFEKRC